MASHTRLIPVDVHTLPPAKDPSVVHLTVSIGKSVYGVTLPMVRLPRIYVRDAETHAEILRAV